MTASGESERPARPKVILVERQMNGRYRASRGNDWAEWHPSEGSSRAVSMATRGFRRELRDLDLGLGCAKCSYLEVEHNITGPEKAPCDGFQDPEDGTAGTRR